MKLCEIVNCQTYPIDKKNENDFKNMVTALRRDYLRNGIVLLPKFLTREALDISIHEVEDAKDEAWMTKTYHNIFMDKGDLSYHQDHVRNRMLQTSVSSLAYDKLTETGPLLRLYHNDHFLNFISKVLGIKNLHRLEDPFGSASVNIGPSGTAQNWHFDESLFSVTLMIQKPESGGLFRNTQPIRDVGNEDEELYEIVQKVVDGTEDMAEILKFEPGTLSIFCGSRCLHEVTTSYGIKDRLVAVFCFSTCSGVRNSEHVQKMFWGRTSTSTAESEKMRS